jgi:putative transposase
MSQEQQPHPWHHRPAHLFVPNATYIVTAATVGKQRLFRGDSRLRMLQDTLFEVAETYGWRLEAWAIFSTHYHWIAQASGDATALTPLIQRLHSQSARRLNELDEAPGRRVWFQYWDTCLTYEKSYYARLNYVHHNAVKHGLVADPEQYPYCSAAWFNANAEPRFRRKVESFRYDRVNVVDDFPV